MEFTRIRALISSSDQISICLVSRNFVNVDNVITCELLVSIPAQFVKMLAAAIASNIFLREFTMVPSSSPRLFLVSRPEIILVMMIDLKTKRKGKDLPSFCGFLTVSGFPFTPFTLGEGVFTAKLR